jgi:predicted nucleic acid-binding protein
VNVIVDTCVWSLAFKKEDKRNKKYVDELRALIDEGRVAMLGPIKQEILSAYKDKKKFNKVNSILENFECETIVDTDYVNAASQFCICRGKGIQATHVDVLICAISIRTGCQIFTLDKDFGHYRKCLPIDLYDVRG